MEKNFCVFFSFSQCEVSEHHKRERGKMVSQERVEGWKHIKITSSSQPLQKDVKLVTTFQLRMLATSMEKTDIGAENFSTQLFSLSLKVREIERRKPEGALGSCVSKRLSLCKYKKYFLIFLCYFVAGCDRKVVTKRRRIVKIPSDENQTFSSASFRDENAVKSENQLRVYRWKNKKKTDAEI
jgi:hypothetical protein